MYLRKAQEFVRSIPKFVTPGWHGRGIVTAAGGSQMLTNTYIQVRALRSLGCTLPVQCFHLGKRELMVQWREILESLGVEFIDAYSIQGQWKTIEGFSLKPFAYYYSRFSEILWLDHDSIPLRNPEEFFNWPNYQDYGLVFWPDLPRWKLEPNVWQAFGLPVPEASKLDWGGRRPDDWQKLQKLPITDARMEAVPIEAGQVLIQKSRIKDALLLAMHYACDNQDYYTKVPGGLVYGDKEALPMACRVLGIPFSVPRYFPSHTGNHAYIQYDFAGEELFIHRHWPGGEWSLNPTNVAPTKQESIHRNFQHECSRLVYEWGGTDWHHKEADETFLDYWFLDVDEGKYGWLQFLPDGTTNGFNHEGIKRWEVWQGPKRDTRLYLLSWGSAAFATWNERLQRWEGKIGERPFKLVRQTVPPANPPKPTREIVAGIPTLNQYALLDKCIDSLLNGTTVPSQIIVVDNGKKYDGRHKGHGKIQIIKPAQNLGVAKSWNLIHSIAEGSDILLMNDDATLGVDILRQMRSVPAMVVCTQNWSAFLQHKEVWDQIGLYDEFFFPGYFEDLDYRRRLDVAGIIPAHVRDVQGTHAGSQTGGVDQQTWNRNRSYYHQKWANGGIAPQIREGNNNGSHRLFPVQRRIGTPGNPAARIGSSR